jgi:hypothetical protein
MRELDDFCGFASVLPISSDDRSITTKVARVKGDWSIQATGANGSEQSRAAFFEPQETNASLLAVYGPCLEADSILRSIRKSTAPESISPGILTIGPLRAAYVSG